MELFVYPIVAILLFIIAFIFKKRFGLLGLSLATGSILSGIWLEKSIQISNALGFQLNIVINAIVAAILIILPAALLIFHGHSYKKLPSRVVGAALFSLLATALLISPLSRIFLIQGVGSDIFLIISNNQSNIIGICLILAVVDKFLSKPVHRSHHKS